MILMAVREHDAEQIVAMLLDEACVRHDQIDAGTRRVAEGDAKIDHHPLATAAIEIEVHANFARPAKGQEKQFVAGSHHGVEAPLIEDGQAVDGQVRHDGVEQYRSSRRRARRGRRWK